jgi:hypothetical protein
MSVSIAKLTYKQILARLQRLLDIFDPNAPKKYTIQAVADRSSKKKGNKDKPKKKAGSLAYRTAKQVGELAELAFAYMAGKMGIGSAKPHGDSLPFDQIAISKTFALHKVQVKCTSYEEDGIYRSCLDRGGTRPYKAGDFDYLACLIVPLDRWYIIPFKEIEGLSSVGFRPHATRDAERGPFDHYYNRWDFLQ